MSWRERLRPASFRNISFQVLDTDMEFGRRNEVHEYPLRDEPYTEDLGRKAKIFTFNAYVIGDNYITERNRLIRAIDQNATSGTLVHPTLGVLQVIPQECRVTFSNQEGGIERFVLTFAEAGKPLYPSSILNTVIDALDKALEARDTLQDFFTSSYSTQGNLDFVKTAAESLLESAVGTFTTSSQLSVQDPVTYANFTEDVNKFDFNISTLASKPTELGESLSELSTQLTSVYPSSEDAFFAQESIINYGNDFLAVPLTTQNRRQQAKNQEALIDKIRYDALLEMISILANFVFESKAEAILFRDLISELMDQAILDIADLENSDLYDAFVDANAAIINDINTRAALLPIIDSIKLDGSIPALVFAYNVFDSSLEVEEIISRNNIINPNFIPAQSVVEYVKP